MNQEQNVQSKKGLSQNLLLIIAGVIILILAIALVFSLSGGDNNESKNEGGNGTVNEGNNENNNVEIEKPNDNPGVIEDKEQDGLKFSNTSLFTSSTNSTLITLVSNTTNSDIEVRIFDIYVKDANGNTIVTLQGYVGGVVPAGESREIESNVDMDLSAAAELEYKIIN